MNQVCRKRFAGNLILILLTAVPLSRVLAGKPPIDLGVFDKWPVAKEEGISSDGQYAACWIEDPGRNSKTTLIARTDGSWRMKINGAQRITFTQGGNLAVYIADDR